MNAYDRRIEDNELPNEEVNRLVQAFFRGPDGQRGFISTGDAIRKIRIQMPQCRIDDGELGDLIARKAIWHGFNISFDHGEPVTAPEQAKQG